MATLKEALDAIVLNKEFKRKKEWQEYQNICIAHWQRKSNEILLYLADLFEKITDKSELVAISIQSFKDTPFEDIPFWEHSESDDLVYNAVFYFKALKIDFDYSSEQNILLLSLYSKLPDCTVIPNV